MSVRLHFHGAAGGVTGSCFRLQTDRASVLIDCGLFQGPKTIKALNYQRFPFDPKGISAVLLTHAHVDHSGLLPKLMLAGFDGPVFATAGTRDLCAVMLPDAGGIQEHEVRQLNRRFQRRGREPVEPIYTEQDGRDVLRLFSKVRLGDWTEAAPGVRARWWEAGHILGSASIEVEVEEGSGAPLRLLFSGDLGPGGSDFVADPDGPSGVDHLIMESTYGRAERPPLASLERRALLAAQVKAAHQAGGPLLMPAFAVERTQELLVDLLQLMESGEVPAGRVFLDSPLAIRASEVFFHRGHDGEGSNPFAALRSSRLLHTTESAEESKAIEHLSGWHVIMAASGMCDAGRIRHHLKRLLWRKDATVLLTGFQAAGTLGRFLQDGQKLVRIQGEEIRVRAQVKTLDAYSGHADAPTLVRWAQARGPVACRVFLVHGEPESRSALQQRLAGAGFDPDRIETPEIDDGYRLERTACEPSREGTPRVAAGAATRLDWHNARSQFELALDELLDGAPDDAARLRLLERLKADLKVPAGA